MCECQASTEKMSQTYIRWYRCQVTKTIQKSENDANDMVFTVAGSRRRLGRPPPSLNHCARSPAVPFPFLLEGICSRAARQSLLRL